MLNTHDAHYGTHFAGVGVFGFDTSDPEEQRFHYEPTANVSTREQKEGRESLGKECGLSS